MKPLFSKVLGCGISFFLGLFLAIVPPCTPKAQAQPKLQILTSLFPLQEFAKAVGGERAEVHLLLPPGAEAHTWEPTPGMVTRLARADIFLYIGASMEPWAAKVLKAVQEKDLIIVEASRGLPLQEVLPAETERKSPSPGRGYSHRQAVDPHIWLDFSLDLKIVEAILSAFLQRDPNSGGYYQKNAEDYKEVLRQLDEAYRNALTSCRHRLILLSGHAAFGYLARRYGLKQMALSGVSPDAEPTPKRMAEIIHQIRKTGVRFIFAEERVHPRASQALAKEAGVKILTLNPGGNLTAEQTKQKLTFAELMRMNLKNLKEGLECSSP